jgi:hypothetical protein
MKPDLQLAVGLALSASLILLQAASPGASKSCPAKTVAGNSCIPWSDLGAKATAQYTGDGLAVSAAENGVVRLHCTFQRLEVEVTSEGLWLTSTVEGAAADRFRVVADYLGRDGGAMVALPDSGTATREATIAHYGGHDARHTSRHLCLGTVLSATIITLTPGSSSPLARAHF